MTTTRHTDLPAASAPATTFCLPDIPQRHPDDMSSVEHLHEPGQTHHISRYLGRSDTTLVTGERYVAPGPAYVAGESRYPDLLIAFDVNPAAYKARNGYVVSEQGKAPDFILEVGSRHTAGDDLEGKKDYYDRLGVGEYWLFDSEGEFYGFTRAGYRLEGGCYQSIEVSEIRPGVFQGHSAALNVDLRAEGGHLGWHDPASGEHIPTFQSQTARAERAESRARAEEVRVQELGAEIRRLREGR